MIDYHTAARRTMIRRCKPLNITGISLFFMIGIVSGLTVIAALKACEREPQPAVTVSTRQTPDLTTYKKYREYHQSMKGGRGHAEND